jgi:hypothetical protein
LDQAERDRIRKALLDYCGHYESGDPYLGDSDDVEAAARWNGEPGAFTKALREAGGDGNAGFIEPLEDRPDHFRRS